MRLSRGFFIAAAAALVASVLVVGGADAAVSCAGPSKGGEWPLFGQNLAGTRHQSAEKKIGPDNVASIQPAWSFSVADFEADGTFESTPAVADGCVYIGTNSGWVFAVNADNGKLVWKTQLPAGVTNLAVASGRVHANVSRANAPMTVALDQDTGKVLWRTTVERMTGSEMTGSPTVYAGMVITGVSGAGAELSSGEDRLGFRGSVNILDAATGRLLSKDYTIPDKHFKQGYAGGGVWSTPAVDTATGYAYVGSGNPYSTEEHPRTNSMLKVDVNPARPRFGEIVDHYKGNTDQYFPVLGASKPACEASGANIAGCELLDLDFGMSPTLFEAGGQKLVGNGQGSGIFHAVTRDTLSYVWTTVVAGPFAGPRGGGTAYDGKALYGPAGSPGHVYALNKNTGNPNWFYATADGQNSWHPTASASGVIYTMDGKGVLNAIDADSGAPLVARSLTVDGGGNAVNLGAGVSIARNTIYAAGGDVVVAYRV